MCEGHPSVPERLDLMGRGATQGFAEMVYASAGLYTVKGLGDSIQLPHFAEGKMEAQTGQVPWLRSQSESCDPSTRNFNSHDGK